MPSPTPSEPLFLPLERPAPLHEPPALRVELAGGEVVEGVPVGEGEGGVLRLRTAAGEREVAAGGAVMTPAGEPRTWWPEPTPLELEELSLGDDPRELLAPLLTQGLRAYALLDGKAVPEEHLGGLKRHKLLPGRLTAEEAKAAPYLVLLDPAEPLVAEILTSGLEEGWGALILSRAPRAPLAGHLKRFLSVTDARSGEPMRFRFFDPVVLRALLPTLAGDDTARLFGAWRCAEGSFCPVCDTPGAGEEPCAWCDAVGHGAGVDRWLIAGLLCPSTPGLLLHARPWPRGADAPTRAERGSCALTVRAEQLEVLGDVFARRQGLPTREDAEVERVSRLFSDLCAHHGPERTRELVRRGFARAAAYRIFAERDVAWFNNVAFSTHPEFDQEPWAAEILHRSTSASDRVAELWRRTKG